MIYIYEALKKLDRHFFHYDQIATRMWRDLTVQAKKDFKVWFDQENDDMYRRQERVIMIPQTQWNSTECKFKCRLHQAGGDWENPVFYFRCQLASGYAGHIAKGEYHRLSQFNSVNNGCFVFIPSKTEGNYSLIPSKKDGEWKANHGDKHKKGIDPENSDRDCWKSLKGYLSKMVQIEIAKVQADRTEAQV